MSRKCCVAPLLSRRCQIGANPSALRMRVIVNWPSRLDSTRSRLALSILTLAKRGPLETSCMAAAKAWISAMVAGRGDIVGRGAQSADHDGILAFRQQAGNDAAALKKIGFAHLVKTFAPIRRCDNRTAVGVQAL